jgi:hypothetical protein
VSECAHRGRSTDRRKGGNKRLLRRSSQSGLAADPTTVFQLNGFLGESTKAPHYIAISSPGSIFSGHFLFDVAVIPARFAETETAIKDRSLSLEIDDCRKANISRSCPDCLMNKLTKMAA